MQLREWEERRVWLNLVAKIHRWARIKTWRNSYHHGETRNWKVRIGKASQTVLLKCHSKIRSTKFVKNGQWEQRLYKFSKGGNQVFWDRDWWKQIKWSLAERYRIKERGRLRQEQRDWEKIDGYGDLMIFTTFITNVNLLLEELVKKFVFSFARAQLIFQKRYQILISIFAALDKYRVAGKSFLPQ